jgi:hypothetical protein
MQDQKSSLSIFSFKKAHRRFLKQILVFFIPVVIGYLVLEYLVLLLPFNYTVKSDYFYSEKEEIEVLVLGSSQLDGAINPKYFDKNTLNLASATQHHNLDFKILKGIAPRLPALKFVILELSYSHLEHPHNSKEFWKNSIYLKYFGINTFERNTYFKDKLLYMARPDFYSKQLVNHYIKKKNEAILNKFGFDERISKGLFYTLKFNDSLIATKKMEIYTLADIKLFKENTEYLYEILNYAEEKELKVIICATPLHKTYLEGRSPDILRRRDSILKLLPTKYENVFIFNKENDTLNYTTSNFSNQNHLNPRGAEKFSKELNEFILRKTQD